MTLSYYNPLLDADSYKLSHKGMYPPSVTGMYSYIEARKPGMETVFFGLQYWLREYLDGTDWSDYLWRRAARRARAHGVPTDVLAQCGYYRPPVRIWAVPEGTVLPTGLPLVAIECTDPQHFWVASFLETALQRAVWYPTTIASNDRRAKKTLRAFAEKTGTDLAFVDFQLHDFGARGASSFESASIGGAAHLLYFKGTDTLSSLGLLYDHYSAALAEGFSVPASEHSVQCAWGPDRQPEYLEHVVRAYGKSGGIVSLVLDGYDLDREIDALCALAPLAKKIGCKIVFRPDSGDAVRNVLRILNKAAAAFGVTETATGHRLLTGAGVLQGDGVDLDSMTAILTEMQREGWASGNIVFGSGGALLQKVCRDDYSFAMKASAVQEDGAWRPIYKAPKTDPAKKSKGGRVATIRLDDGSYEVGRIDDPRSIMRLVWDAGELVSFDDFDAIRERCAM